jgi:hypothetical protein
MNADYQDIKLKTERKISKTFFNVYDDLGYGLPENKR